jgi:fermentation-respiration switch protein FrsA (DUF1100 family)
MQDRATYFPTPQDFDNCPGFANAQKINHNGTRMYFTHYESSAALVIVFHGNAGSACDRRYLKTILDERGVSSLFVEYAGYSNDTKKPSRDLILKDADNAMAYAKSQNPKKIILLSESIGGGAASHLAKDNPDAIILISPFSKLSDVARVHYPIYPIGLMIRADFDNVAALSKYRGRVAIIHGTADNVIPMKLSKTLFDTIVASKKYYTINGAGHNDILGFTQTNDALNSELNETIK